MMPELDGYGVLEVLHTDTALREIPVVMISALEDLNCVVRCIELGAVDDNVNRLSSLATLRFVPRQLRCSRELRRRGDGSGQVVTSLRHLT